MSLIFRTATQPVNQLSLSILGRSGLWLLSLLLAFVLAAAPAWAASVTLEWDANPQPELRGYKIFCRLNSDLAYDYDRPVWAGTEGKCKITGLASNTDYCFVVRAFDIKGNESGDSNEVFYPGSQLNVSVTPGSEGDAAPLPNTPEPSPMPENGEQTALDPILANLSEPDNEAKAAHIQTQWQVFREDGDQETLCVYDIRSEKALQELHLPPLVLDELTTYYWRSRYINVDDNAGEWATPHYFTTPQREGDADGDGVLDAQATTADADLNADGIADNTQEKLRGVYTVVGDGSVAVDALAEDSVLAIERVRAFDPEDPALNGGNGYDLPLGLVAFKLALAEGVSTVSITLHLSHGQGGEMSLLTYDVAQGWQNAADLAKSSQEGRTLRLNLTDGGREDVDGVKNGLIIFTGGYGRSIDYRGTDVARGARGDAEVLGATMCFIGTAGL